MTLLHLVMFLFLQFIFQVLWKEFLILNVWYVSNVNDLQPFVIWLDPGKC